MKELNKQLAEQRNTLINKVFSIASFVLIFLMASVVSRAIENGLKPIMIVQVLIITSVWVVAIFRKRVSLNFKMNYSLIIVFIGGVAAVLGFGLMGNSSLFFLVLIVFANAYQKHKLGWGLSALTIVLYGVITTLSYMGKYDFNFDPVAYNASISAWALSLITLVIMSIITLLVLRSMNKVIINNLKLLDTQKGELEKLNDTKNKIFTVISHDLRRPFSSILNVLQLINDGNTHLKEDRKMELFKKIEHDTQNMYGLLENLLSWSHSELNDTEKVKMEVSVNRIVNSAVAPFLNMARSKSIEIQKYILDSSKVLVDEASLIIVISNILSNAIKFTPADGVIKISCHVDEEHTEIRVADTGTGMSREALNRIFDLGDTMTTLGTENEKGAGVGLGVCFELVKNMDGKLWATSEKAGGSTFYISLKNCDSKA